MLKKYLRWHKLQTGQLVWLQSFVQYFRVSSSCSSKVLEKCVTPSSPATKYSQSVWAGKATASIELFETLPIGPGGSPLCSLVLYGLS